MKTRTLATICMALALVTLATGCIRRHRRKVNNLPPSKMLFEPGPGVGGPGPGVMMNGVPPMAPMGVSQVSFVGEPGMHVVYDTSGQGFFDSEPLVTPSRQNFQQGAIYRLKLKNVPGKAGEEYYPTLEVGPTTPRTDAYLAHNAIPIQLTAEDFDQVQSNNFVTKVIYLPDPDHQKMALAAIETLVSTRLDPGVDPIVEADRRGSILAILRLGNKDLGLPGDPNNLAANGAGGVQQVNYHAAMGGGFAGPGPQPMPGMAPSIVAGVTGPQYGMPITGTPIGLPGPPHIPLGVPAGLQKHAITNHTHTHLPPPVQGIHIGVEHKPGISYPKPPHRVNIVEKAKRDRLGPFKQPFGDMFEKLTPGH